ncbi:hypothetical protein BpHYR1_037084 [Brachionus plicatilis]|uniref:Uncharacterized protein n=1 Tax=Brachionus plicatilis TaxID=10195 RepID=A0A3M7SBW6_BRAPC|nr:hypothetical protein BpHYR1_037084 [Brachionus plicatilis]
MTCQPLNSLHKNLFEDPIRILQNFVDWWNKWVFNCDNLIKSKKLFDFFLTEAFEIHLEKNRSKLPIKAVKRISEEKIEFTLFPCSI